MSYPRATGNRRDRRAANQKLKDLIDLGDKCVQVAEGCYFDSACRAPAIDLRNAQALDKAWQKRVLADETGRVYGFTRA